MRYFSSDTFLSIIWKGTAPEESIKEVRNSMVELLAMKGCGAVVNDVQEFYSASTEVLAELTESDWDKEAHRLGVRYIAHVLKPDTDMPAASPQALDGPKIKYFFDKIEAVNWIQQVTRS
ncbi:hypothetical protein [Pontibacter sp. HJ8]